MVGKATSWITSSRSNAAVWTLHRICNGRRSLKRRSRIAPSAIAAESSRSSGLYGFLLQEECRVWPLPAQPLQIGCCDVGRGEPISRNSEKHRSINGSRRLFVLSAPRNSPNVPQWLRDGLHPSWIDFDRDGPHEQIDGYDQARSISYF